MVVIALFASKFLYFCSKTKESGAFQTPDVFGPCLQTLETSSGYLKQNVIGEEDSELKENLKGSSEW